MIEIGKFNDWYILNCVKNDLSDTALYNSTTTAMDTGNGVLVRTRTVLPATMSEALTFVPNVTIEKYESGGGRLVPKDI